MKKLFILLFMLFFYSSGISCATTFSSEDLVGHWQGSFMETTASNDTRVSRNIQVEIAPTDYAVSGTWSDKGYANSTLYSGTITDGSVDITVKGEITGSLDIKINSSTYTDTITIINGWMDIDKNILYIVTERPGGELSMGMLVKYQHATNGYPTSDLEGTWFVNNIQSTGDLLGEDPGDWVVDILSATSAGLCTGDWYSSGASGTIDSPSSLSLDSSHGMVSGTLYNDLLSEINVYFGQMSSDKNTGNLLTNSDTLVPDGGDLTSGVFLRSGGSGFVNQDLKGTWAMYTTEVYGTDMYWFYGEITLDESGKMIKGSWNHPSGSTGIYTTGQVNIADSGALSGTIAVNMDPQYTYHIKKGLLSLSKNHASFTLESSNKKDIGFMIRKSNNNTIVPVLNLLIGN